MGLAARGESIRAWHCTSSKKPLCPLRGVKANSEGVDSLKQIISQTKSSNAKAEGMGMECWT